MADFNVVARLTANVKGFTQGMSEAQSSIRDFENTTGTAFDKVGGAMQGIGKGLTVGVTAPLVAMAGVATKVGSDYEASMSHVQAISGATGDELNQLKDVAREMGATTRYSASEAADALGYMALAGWDTHEMTDALPGVLDLATAGGLELASASDIVTDMMSMFGMEAREASRASDVFASAQANSNTNVEQLSQALLNAGPAASAAGQDIEQTSAILGIMANQGLKGSSAGTALNAMFRDLQGSAEDGAVAIGDTSVAVYDAEGNMRAMTDIISDVESATADMTDEQRNAALSAIFQQQSLRGLNLVIGAGSDSVRELEGTLYDSTGTATEMAGVMDDNVQGALLGLKSAAEDVMISFFELSEGPIRTLIDRVTELIRWFGGLDSQTQQTIFLIAGIVGAIGPVIWVMGSLITQVTKVAGAFKWGFGLIGKVSAIAGKAIAFLTSPVGLVVLAIGALIAIGVLLYKNWDTIKEKATELGQRLAQAWENIKTRVVEIVDNIRQSIIDKAIEIEQGVIGALDGLLPAIGDLWNKIYQTIFQWVTSIFSDTNSQFKNMVMSIDKIFMELWMIIEAIWTFIKETFNNAVGFIMALVNGDFTVMKDFIIQQWETVKDFFSRIWESIRGIFEGVLSFIKAFVLGSMEEIGNNIRETWENIKIWFSEALENIRETVRSGFELMVEGIGNAIDSIIEFFNMLPERIGYFLGVVIAETINFVARMIMNAYELGVNFLETVTTFFRELPGRVQTFVTDTWDRVKTWAGNMRDSAEETGTNFLNAITSWFSQLPGRINNFVTDAWNRVSTWASNMWTKAKETGSNFLNAITTWFRQLPSRIGGFITSAWNRVTTWASNMWAKASETGSRFITNIMNWFSQLPSRIGTWLSSTISRVTTFATNLGIKAREAGRNFLDRLLAEARKVPSQIFNIGKDIVRGAWRGITSMAGWFGSKVSGFFGGIVKGVKDRLKIFSPSRIFRDEIGKMVVRGFGLGIERNEGEATKPMDSLIDNILGAWDGTESDLNAQLNGMVGGSIGADVSMTNTYVPMQPANIHFTFGNKSFRGFVEDIHNVEGENIRLEESYGLGG